MGGDRAAFQRPSEGLPDSRPENNPRSTMKSVFFSKANCGQAGRCRMRGSATINLGPQRCCTSLWENVRGISARRHDDHDTNTQTARSARAARARPFGSSIGGWVISRPSLWTKLRDKSIDQGRSAGYLLPLDLALSAGPQQANTARSTSARARVAARSEERCSCFNVRLQGEMAGEMPDSRKRTTRESLVCAPVPGCPPRRPSRLYMELERLGWRAAVPFSTPLSSGRRNSATDRTGIA